MIHAVVLLLLLIQPRPISLLTINDCVKEWVPKEKGGYKYRIDCSNLGFKKIPDKLPPLTAELLLNGNSISYLADETFVGLSLLHTLDLSGNDISTLNESVFANLELKSLVLSRNRLHCDWKLWWLVDYAKKLEKFEGKCFSPRPLRERPIKSISKDDLAVDCASVQKLSDIVKDGEYSIRVFSQDNSYNQISIYCNEMDTENPKEYLTLPSGKSNNFVNITWVDSSCDLSLDKQLLETASDVKEQMVFAQYSKVRLDVKSLAIDTTDVTFSSSKIGQFGQPAICGSSSCLQGNAKIDLRGTKFQMKQNRAIEEVISCNLQDKCAYCNISESIGLELINSVKSPFKACTLPFGLQDNRIPDSSITATSFAGKLFQPHHARLNNPFHSGWCAKQQDLTQRLFIDLGSIYTLSGISTQGYKNSKNWVTEYHLHYSADAKNYFPYEHLGYPESIVANVDSDSVATHWFEPRFKARYIRLTPLKWSTNKEDPKICLRVELYGCENDITSYILQQNPEQLCLTADTTSDSLTYPLIRHSRCIGDEFMFTYHHRKIKHTKSGSCLSYSEENQFVLTRNCSNTKLVFQNVRHASKEAFLIKDLNGFCARLYQGSRDYIYASWDECQQGGFTVLQMTRRGTKGFRPRFHSKTHIVRTDLFRKVIFKCQPSADPHVVFKWTKHSKYNPKVNPISDNVSQKKDYSILTFSNVTWEQRGKYYCNVWNSDGNAVKVYNLIVNPFQEFKKVPNNQKIIHGYSANFHCISYGIPKPQTLWVFKNQDGIFKNISLMLKDESSKYELFENGTLFIEKVSYEDEGTYTCISRTPGLERNVSASLDVYVTQNFTKTPISKNVLFGSSALFNCISEGLPKPEIVWKIKFNHIERLVTIDTTYKHQYKVLNNGSLLVKSAMIDDEGRYYCVSKSPGLIRNVSAVLSVYVTQEFIIAPVSQKILYHKNVSFDCESIGVPPPRTIWKYKKYNEFIELEPDGKKYFFSDSKLTIQKVDYRDEGQYYCFSESPRLIRNASAKLEVYVTQEFDIIPQSSRVLFGSNYTLSCSSIGIPMPVIEWKFRAIKSNKVKPITMVSSRVISDDYSVHIINASMQESGHYICMSYSPGMIKNSTAVVNVYVNQNFTAKPRNLNLLQGETAAFDCISVGVPKPKTTWMFSNTIKTIQLETSKQYTILSNNTLIVQNVKNRDEGFYICISESPGYITNVTAKLTVHIKPQVSISTSNLTLSIGRSLSVSCEAAGDPTPDVVWYKVIEDIKYKVVSVKNIFQVNRLRKQDQGHYFCEAENAAGKAKEEFTLIVRATCPLDTIANSKLNSVKFIYFENEKVDVSCKPGFKLEGNKTLNCGIDGKWDTIIPKCLDINECEKGNTTTNSTTCPPGIICENAIGSYKCLCGNNFVYINNKCMRKPPEGESTNPQNNDRKPTTAPPEDYSWLEKLIEQYNEDRVDEELFLLQIQRLSQSIQQLEHDNWKKDALKQVVNSLNVAVVNADAAQENNINQIINKCQILLSIADYSLNSNFKTFWEEINADGNGTEQVMKNIELYLTKKMSMAKKGMLLEKKIFIFETLDVLLLPVTGRMMNKDLELQMAVNNSKTYMKIPKENYALLKNSVGVAVLFKTIHELLPQSTNYDDSLAPATEVFSVSFTTNKKLQLTKPVIIGFNTNQVINQPTCAFWDFSKASGGEWSSEGCETISNETSKEILCECNHLTNFAVLVPRGTGMKVLYLTFTLTLAIGAGLCILLAFITCMSHVCCSSYSKSDRSTILSNITFIVILGVLLFAGAIFVSAMGIVPDSMATHFCFSLVGIVQLLGVAFFCWTFVEAIQLFYATRTVIGKSSGHLSLFYLIGWGVPIGIVAATAMMIYFNKFKLQSKCVVQVSLQLLILLVGAPASFFILGTFIVYIIVTISMKKSKDLLSESVAYHTKRSLLFSSGLIVVHCGVLVSVALYLHYQSNKLFHHVLGVAVVLEGIYLIVYHLILDRNKTPKPKQNSKKRNSYSTKDTVAYSPTLTSEEVTSSEGDQKYLIKRSSRRTSSESSNKASPFSVRNRLGDESRDTQMTAMYGGETSSPSPEMKPLLKHGSSKEMEETIFEDDTIANDLPTFTNGTISKTNSLPRSTNSLPRCYQKRFQHRDNDESSVDGTKSLKRTASKASSIVSIETHATASSQQSGIPVYFPAAPPHYEMSLTNPKQSDLPNSFDYFNNSNPNSRCTSFGIDSDRMSNISSELSNILNELQAFNTTDRHHHDSQESLYNNISSKTLPLKTFKRDPIETDLSLHSSTFKPERRYAKTEIKFDENQGKVNGGFQEKHRVRVLRGKNILGEADPADGLHSNTDSIYSSL